MVYDSGVIIGRFQHFHIGHESLVQTCKQLCDRPIIFIGSSQEVGTERNPYNINTRTDVVREIYGDTVKIIALPDLTNENDISYEWGKYVLENIDRVLYKVPEIMVYGDDEERTNWFSKKDSMGTIKIIVPRSNIDISATRLREMIVRDERKEWMKYTNPKIHKLYPRLREELLAVPFYREKFDKLIGKI